MVNTIQDSSKNILISMNEVVNEVQEGLDRAENSSDALKEIEVVVGKILDKMEILTLSMEKLNNRANYISQNVVQLDL